MGAFTGFLSPVPQATSGVEDQYVSRSQYVQDWQQLIKQLNFMFQMQRCMAYQAAANVVFGGGFDATSALLSFDTIAYNIAGSDTTTAFLTVPGGLFSVLYSGLYFVQGQIKFTTTLAGDFQLYMHGNLSAGVPDTILAQTHVVAAANTTQVMQVAGFVVAKSGDVINFGVGQNTGANQTIVGADNVFGSTIYNTYGSITLLSKF